VPLAVEFAPLRSPSEEVGRHRSHIPRARTRRFTTHTPVESGHDRFPYELVTRILNNEEVPGRGAFINTAVLRNLAGPERLNMTRLALNLSDFVNGVAKRHAEISAGLFPGYQVRSITNGVHPYTWTTESFRALYDRYVPGWCHEPEQLVRVDAIPDAAILDAHARAKQTLIDTVRNSTGITLHPKKPILGFARRMTAYKRPDLLFSDPERLRAIARERSFQIVLAGKAHPRDEEGKRLIAQLHARARSLADAVPVVFLPDYDMTLAQVMVAGVDVW
jgi:starch phosphorylase